jgi:hypothetical protein
MGGAAFTLNDIAVADVNGDGRPDLIAGVFASAGGGSGTGVLSVRLQDTMGGFDTALHTPRGRSGIRSLGLGDFNRDGHPDVVAGRAFEFALTVFYGDGAGGFPAVADVGAGRIVAVGVGDLNGDAWPDAAGITDEATRGFIFLNDGAGALQAPTAYPLSPVPGDFIFGVSLALADVTGDGALDVLAADGRGGRLFCLVGGVPFTPSASAPYPAGGNPNAIAAGDLNEDGLLDAVTVNRTGPGVSVVLNGESF